MPKKIDLDDLKILESLGAYGPRNITDVARKIGVEAETLRRKLERIPSRIFFKYQTNVYCTYLGLKKAVVIAEAVSGSENLLLECLRANSFWIYSTRSYGMNEGCIAVYTLPSDHSDDFAQFIQSVAGLGITRSIQTLWSTCFQSVNSKTKWFDRKSGRWVFSWDEWINEINAENTRLPRTLVDPSDYPIMGDECDLFILKELEKNPTISLTRLAEMLGVSPQAVEYHYHKHITKRGLIEGFEVRTFQFDMSFSDMFIFVFKFDDAEKCKKFAVSLLDKPFVGGLGKIINENSLIVDVYLPKLEFRRLIDSLAKLVENDTLLSYYYVILDLAKAKRQTIPYEHFRNKQWIYNHHEHLQKLKETIEKTRTEHGGISIIPTTA
jgi:DNA-binding Lrp family transcriptional regulator